jgi:hypothetical protein
MRRVNDGRSGQRRERRTFGSEREGLHARAVERPRITWQSMIRQVLSTPAEYGRMDIEEFNRYAAFEVFGRDGIEALRAKNPRHHLVRIYDGDIPLDTVPSDD